MKEQDYKRSESEKQLVSTENLSLLEQVEILHTEVNLLKEENSHKDNYVQQLELIAQQLRIKNRIKR